MARIKTQGTKLQIEKAGSPNEFADIGQVSGITGFRSGEAVEINVTDFDSSAQEFLMGLKDEGTLNFNLNYDPDDTQHELLETHRTNQTLADFKIQLAAGTNNFFSFSGYVQSFALNLEADDAVRGEVSIRVSGAITKSSS